MESARRGNRGYAMAALLVAMSVMAVLMSALLPVWTHMATREKEEELIFRGKQYARAIGLFQRKFANTAPPTIDVLVEQRFLRKKYKDPITNDDFQPIYANQQMQPGTGAAQVAGRPGQQANTRLSTPAQQQSQSGFTGGIGAQGGVIGVTSKSKEQSIKVYNGRDHYNEWAFIFVQTAQRPGQSVNLQGLPGQGQGGPGGRGGPGQNTGPGGGPFGMQPGGFPGGRGGPQGPPGFGVPNRPPIGMPGQFPGQFPQNGFPQNFPQNGFPQNPGQNPNTIQGPNGTTFTPVAPPQPRRPPGQ
jgi:type II secretory pathway pseudopilin PulG